MNLRKTVRDRRPLAFLIFIAVSATYGGKGLAAPSARNAIVPSARAFAGVALPTFADRSMQQRHDARKPVTVIRPNAAAAYVYGCAFTGDFCNIYSAKTATLLGSVTGLTNPSGTVADKKGIWYVTNTGASNVLVFSPGGASQINTLTDAGESPVDVAVSKRLVAVSNSGTLGSAGVAVYKIGATSASYTLTYPGAVQGGGVAFDGHGNCFWSFEEDLGHIVEFPKCSSKKPPIDLGLAFGVAAGLAFDRKDNLWFVDPIQGLFECIGVSSCSLVIPNGSTFADPTTINFNKKASDLYLMDEGFGIYSITGLDALRSRHVQPDYIVTPFVAIPASDTPVGVAAGPGD